MNTRYFSSDRKAGTQPESTGDDDATARPVPSSPDLSGISAIPGYVDYGIHHGAIPGYVDYGIHHGAPFMVDVENGRFVFFYRPLDI